VEDERLIRTTLRHTLSRMGYDVLVAEDAGRAVAVAQACEDGIDLLLSDMVLPDASGAELAKTLTQARPALKVLFMSAYPSELLVQQGRIAPGTRTLEKPFDEDVLAAAVSAALKQERSPKPANVPPRA
jgi:DNA-binding response OmpR family regulator